MATSSSSRREQPPWTLPAAAPGAALPPLRIYNSLTKKKEPFVPIDPAGKKVTWYCCGPTVYDAGHLGHARNYVTTDVLRRIMRDYFGFEVEFVQNVTDVDDKIILRARQKHLLDEFTAQNPSISPAVLETAWAAWAAYFNSKVALDAEKAAGPTPASFHPWASSAHPKLMSLIAQDLSNKTPDDALILDEASAKLKMHLSTLLTSSTAILSPPSSSSPADFYAATSNILLPYLDALHRDRTYTQSVFAALSSYWERHFNTDMATLNVLPPTTTTRVSEFIPENVAFVEKLVAKGFAYATADGSVYFDIAAYEAAGHHYAKLQPWNRGDEALMADGEGALSSEKASTLPTTTTTVARGAPQERKKSQQDFALWKASKAGEPSWESPWGRGRPGWHIECSVMCSEVLGGRVDIHSGGVDLAFPHHDNEIAQSEAYWDGCCEGAPETRDGRHQWINYFLHMGHLNIHGSKMSKSLKNFVSIRDALERGGWTPRGLRVVFLMGGWKEGIEVREGVLAEANKWETTVEKFFRNVKALVEEEEERERGGEQIPLLFGPAEHAIRKELDNARTALHAALCDNFNTPDAMKVLTDLISQANKYMNTTSTLHPIKEIARWITRIVNILGLDAASAEDKIGWSDATSSSFSSTNATNEDALMPYLRALSGFRDAVRQLAIANPEDKASRDLLLLSDRLRDYDLAALGVSLDDRDSAVGKPALIKFASAAELTAAREEKEKRAAEKERKKEEARAKREAEERKREEEARVSHREVYRTEEWSEWDEDGMPVRDREGKEVTKSRGKVLRKGWERQRKLHEAWLEAKAKKGE